MPRLAGRPSPGRDAFSVELSCRWSVGGGEIPSRKGQRCPVTATTWALACDGTQIWKSDGRLCGGVFVQLGTVFPSILLQNLKSLHISSPTSFFTFLHSEVATCRRHLVLTGMDRWCKTVSAFLNDFYLFLKPVVIELCKLSARATHDLRGQIAPRKSCSRVAANTHADLEPRKSLTQI